MSEDAVTLVISTFENRIEVQVPYEFITKGSTTPSRELLSYLRELSYEYPEDGMLTKIESGYVLHSVPKFG